MSLIRTAYLDISGDGDAFRVGEGLRLTFELESVISNFGGEPSAVKVYNLAQETIGRIRDEMMVRLTAGYVDDAGIVDEGTITRSRTYTMGLERITEIYIIKRETDSRAKFTVDYPEGPVRLRQIVQDCLDAMGAVAESLDAIPDITVENPANRGSAKTVLRNHLKAQNIGWSQRQGTVIFHPLGGMTPGAATHMINEREGLIGSPALSEQGASIVVHFDRTIVAGDVIMLESRDVSGSYTASKVRHTGDTYGSEAWSTKLELTTPTEAAA